MHGGPRSLWAGSGQSISHGIGEGVVRVWYFESNERYAALLLFLEPPGADNPLKDAESRQY